MIDVIISNPFRVLGVYASASMREVKASVTRLNAYSKVGREIELPVDFPLVLPKLDRNIDSIQQSERTISFPENKLKFSLFWFHNLSDQDTLAFKDLSNGNIESFKSYSSTCNNFAACINNSTIRIIEGEYTHAISSILRLVHTNELYNSFIESTLDNSLSITPEDLFKLYATTLCSEVINTNLIECATQAGCNQDELSFFKKHIGKTYIDRIQSQIKALEANLIEASPITHIECAKKLLENTRYDLSCLQSINSETELNDASNLVAQKILDWCIKSYNMAYEKIIDDIATFTTVSKTAHELLKEINFKNLDPGISARLKENTKTISEAAKDPEDYRLLHIANNPKICWYCDGHATHTTKLSYKKERTEHGAFTKKVITETRTITVNICDECDRRQTKDAKITLLCACLAFIIELVVAYILFAEKKYYDYSFHWEPFLWIIGGNLFGGYFITLLLGMPFKLIANLFNKDRKFKNVREDSDHPLVKKVRKQGFS